MRWAVVAMRMAFVGCAASSEDQKFSERMSESRGNLECISILFEGDGCVAVSWSMICSRLAVSDGESSKMSSASELMTRRKKGERERPAEIRLARIVGFPVALAVATLTILAWEQA